jgi:hypothetical protein
MGDGPDVGSGVLDGDGDSNGDDDSDVWTRMFGMVVAGVVAVVGFATLSAAGIGYPLSRGLFSILLGVVVAQTFEGL